MLPHKTAAFYTRWRIIPREIQLCLRPQSETSQKIAHQIWFTLYFPRMKQITMTTLWESKQTLVNYRLAALAARGLSSRQLNDSAEWYYGRVLLHTTGQGRPARMVRRARFAKMRTLDTVADSTAINSVASDGSVLDIDTRNTLFRGIWYPVAG